MEAESPCPTSGPAGTGTFVDMLAGRWPGAPELATWTATPGTLPCPSSSSTWTPGPHSVSWVRAPCRNSSQTSSSSFLTTDSGSTVWAPFRNSSQARSTSYSSRFRFRGTVASSSGATVTPGNSLVGNPAVLMPGCGTAVRPPPQGGRRKGGQAFPEGRDSCGVGREGRRTINNKSKGS